MAANETYTTQTRVEADLVLVSGETRDATRLEAALNAAHAFVDRYTRRSFVKTASEAREFTSHYYANWLHVGDMATVPTQVRVRDTVDEAWQTLTATEWAVRPAEFGRPYRAIMRREPYCWPRSVFATVEVTAEWGWAMVPADIEEATRLLAVRYISRPKWAIMQFAGDGSLLRVDPDVTMILDEFRLDL